MTILEYRNHTSQHDSLMNQEAISILIVDDEPGLLFSLKAYLEDEGHIVTGVTTGKEAIRALTEHAYDIVIIDVRLPDIDGNEVILRTQKTDSPLFL